jgi:hypothetical protein
MTIEALVRSLMGVVNRWEVQDPQRYSHWAMFHDIAVQQHGDGRSITLLFNQVHETAVKRAQHDTEGREQLEQATGCCILTKLVEPEEAAFRGAAHQLEPGAFADMETNGTILETPQEYNPNPEWQQPPPLTEQWGVGDKADSKAFATVSVEGVQHDLITGEHPHSKSDDRIYARSPSGEVVGFKGNRPLVSVMIEESNYHKGSYYSGDQVRAACRTTITFDGLIVYSTAERRNARDHATRLHDLITKLLEHPVYNPCNANWQEAVVGRKVYYRDQPAVVKRVNWRKGEVTLVADGGVFRQPGYSDIDPDPDDDRTSIRTDFLDDSIFWFRS